MSFTGYDGSKEHARYKERAGFFCGVEIFEEGFRTMDNAPTMKWFTACVPLQHCAKIEWRNSTYGGITDAIRKDASKNRKIFTVERTDV